MARSDRNALIAAAAIMLLFGFGSYFMPAVMIAVGNISTAAAGGIAVLFVACFFLVFWFRGRSQQHQAAKEDRSSPRETHSEE